MRSGPRCPRSASPGERAGAAVGPPSQPFGLTLVDDRGLVIFFASVISVEIPAARLPGGIEERARQVFAAPQEALLALRLRTRGGVVADRLALRRDPHRLGPPRPRFGRDASEGSS